MDKTIILSRYPKTILNALITQRLECPQRQRGNKHKSKRYKEPLGKIRLSISSSMLRVQRRTLRWRTMTTPAASQRSLTGMWEHRKRLSHVSHGWQRGRFQDEDRGMPERTSIATHRVQRIGTRSSYLAIWPNSTVRQASMTAYKRTGTMHVMLTLSLCVGTTPPVSRLETRTPLRMPQFLSDAIYLASIYRMGPNAAKIAKGFDRFYRVAFNNDVWRSATGFKHCTFVFG